MNHAKRLRPRPLTPFIVADALAPAPAAAVPTQDAGPSLIGPIKPLPPRAETAVARPARPLMCRPGELVCASPA